MQVVEATFNHDHLASFMILVSILISLFDVQHVISAGVLYSYCQMQRFAVHLSFSSASTWRLIMVCVCSQIGQQMLWFLQNRCIPSIATTWTSVCYEGIPVIRLLSLPKFQYSISTLHIWWTYRGKTKTARKGIHVRNWTPMWKKNTRTANALFVI